MPAPCRRISGLENQTEENETRIVIQLFIVLFVLVIFISNSVFSFREEKSEALVEAKEELERSNVIITKYKAEVITLYLRTFCMGCLVTIQSKWVFGILNKYHCGWV